MWRLMLSIVSVIIIQECSGSCLNHESLIFEAVLFDAASEAPTQIEVLRRGLDFAAANRCIFIRNCTFVGLMLEASSKKRDGQTGGYDNNLVLVLVGCTFVNSTVTISGEWNSGSQLSIVESRFEGDPAFRSFPAIVIAKETTFSDGCLVQLSRNVFEGRGAATASIDPVVAVNPGTIVSNESRVSVFGNRWHSAFGRFLVVGGLECDGSSMVDISETSMVGGIDAQLISVDNSFLLHNCTLAISRNSIVASEPLRGLSRAPTDSLIHLSNCVGDASIVQISLNSVVFNASRTEAVNVSGVLLYNVTGMGLSIRVESNSISISCTSTHQPTSMLLHAPVVATASSPLLMTPLFSAAAAIRMQGFENEVTLKRSSLAILHNLLRVEVGVKLQNCSSVIAAPFMIDHVSFLDRTTLEIQHNHLSARVHSGSTREHTDGVWTEEFVMSVVGLLIRRGSLSGLLVTIRGNIFSIEPMDLSSRTSGAPSPSCAHLTRAVALVGSVAGHVRVVMSNCLIHIVPAVFAGSKSSVAAHADLSVVQVSFGGPGLLRFESSCNEVAILDEEHSAPSQREQRVYDFPFIDVVEDRSNVFYFNDTTCTYPPSPLPSQTQSSSRAFPTSSHTLKMSSRTTVTATHSISPTSEQHDRVREEEAPFPNHLGVGLIVAVTLGVMTGNTDLVMDIQVIVSIGLLRGFSPIARSVSSSAQWGVWPLFWWSGAVPAHSPASRDVAEGVALAYSTSLILLCAFAAHLGSLLAAFAYLRISSPIVLGTSLWGLSKDMVRFPGLATRYVVPLTHGVVFSTLAVVVGAVDPFRRRQEALGTQLTGHTVGCAMLLAVAVLFIPMLVEHYTGVGAAGSRFCHYGLLYRYLWGRSCHSWLIGIGEVSAFPIGIWTGGVASLADLYSSATSKRGALHKHRIRIAKPLCFALVGIIGCHAVPSGNVAPFSIFSHSHLSPGEKQQPRMAPQEIAWFTLLLVVCGTFLVAPLLSDSMHRTRLDASIYLGMGFLTFMAILGSAARAPMLDEITWHFLVYFAILANIVSIIATHVERKQRLDAKFGTMMIESGRQHTVLKQMHVAMDRLGVKKLQLLQLQQQERFVAELRTMAGRLPRTLPQHEQEQLPVLSSPMLEQEVISNHHSDSSVLSDSSAATNTPPEQKGTAVNPLVCQ